MYIQEREKIIVYILLLKPLSLQKGLTPYTCIIVTSCSVPQGTQERIFSVSNYTNFFQKK